jgi:ABC-type branched-subunit amino acid transport system substrate-binding protein
MLVPAEGSRRATKQRQCPGESSKPDHVDRIFNVRVNAKVGRIGRTIDKITSSGAEVVFNTIVPPGVTPFLEQLYNSGFTKRGGQIVCTYMDENVVNYVPAAHVEGLYSCLDCYHSVSDPFTTKLINQYDKLFPGDAKFTAGGACSGLYRGLKLWEAAVKEAGSLQQEDVIRALDRAKIAAGPGGPAEMVPGQHHVRMNMYIAQAQNGNFKIVKSLGVIDPKEETVRWRDSAA